MTIVIKYHMVYIVRGNDMRNTSALFEELSISEIDIFKRSAADYIRMEGLEVIEDLVPLSTRCSSIPYPLFVPEDFNNPMFQGNT